ncbi:MAG: PatB family C-S lyase [Clostridia bacterium]|nr:PatB family C-S lyase [Clostridia bacterium]
MSKTLYDEAFFDRGLDRTGTGAIKWEACKDRDMLPMWVADMDFASPDECVEALQRRASHPTYGYTDYGTKDKKALCDFWMRRHQLQVEEEAVLSLPCVVTGLKIAIQAFTEKGDGVIIQSPVYGPFAQSVRVTGRTIMDAQLLPDEKGHYRMNLEKVEEHCRHGAKLFMLCNPHNPVSRCWTEEELRALLNILNRYGVILVSDEIHADFVYAPFHMVPLLSLQKERVVSLCAASKTFNLAGLQHASCLCPDREMREKIERTIESCGVVSGNIFGLEASCAAYLYGDAWLDGLIAYLEGNRRELKEQLREHLPEAILSPMEATYLGWLDLRAWNYTCDELKARTEKSGLMLTDGTFFGEDVGEGFERINIGCPRKNIRESVRRLKKALEADR